VTRGRRDVAVDPESAMKHAPINQNENLKLTVVMNSRPLRSVQAMSPGRIISMTRIIRGGEGRVRRQDMQGGQT